MRNNTLFNVGIPPMQGREMLNRETFGGNSGEQGVFDPADPEMRERAQQRLAQLAEQYGPMLAPDAASSGGSSITGVVDPTWWFNKQGQDYYDRSNAVTEAQNIKRSLTGKAPLSIRSILGEGL